MGNRRDLDRLPAFTTMNPSTELLLVEMRRLFAEQSARLDRLFDKYTTAAPSTIAGVLPAPMVAASVAPAVFAASVTAPAATDTAGSSESEVVAPPPIVDEPFRDAARPLHPPSIVDELYRDAALPSPPIHDNANPVVTLIGSDSAHDDHIQEEHIVVTPNLHSTNTTVFEKQMVVPEEEDAVPSTLPNRCLMNCLFINRVVFHFHSITAGM